MLHSSAMRTTTEPRELRLNLEISLQLISAGIHTEITYICNYCNITITWASNAIQYIVGGGGGNRSGKVRVRDAVSRDVLLVQSHFASSDKVAL